MLDKQKLLDRLNEYKEAAQSYMRNCPTEHLSGYYEGRRDQIEWMLLEIERGDFDKENQHRGGN